MPSSGRSCSHLSKIGASEGHLSHGHHIHGWRQGVPPAAPCHYHWCARLGADSAADPGAMPPFLIKVLWARRHQLDLPGTGNDLPQSLDALKRQGLNPG